MRGSAGNDLFRLAGPELLSESLGYLAPLLKAIPKCVVRKFIARKLVSQRCNVTREWGRHGHKCDHSPVIFHYSHKNAASIVLDPLM